jgi:hypothetical protein
MGPEILLKLYRILQKVNRKNPPEITNFIEPQEIIRILVKFFCLCQCFMTFKKQCERMQNFTNLTKGYKSANFL